MNTGLYTTRILWFLTRMKGFAIVNELGKRWKNLAVPAILIYGVDGLLAKEFLGETSTTTPIVDEIARLARADVPNQIGFSHEGPE